MSTYYFGLLMFTLLTLFLFAFGFRIIWLDRKREKLEKENLKETKSH